MTFLIRLTFADASTRDLLVHTARDAGIQHEAFAAVDAALADARSNWTRLLRHVEVVVVGATVSAQEGEG